MDSQELRSLQEAYLDVYYDLEEKRAPGVKPYTPNRLNPLPKEKPLSGKKGDGSGYGADEKFKKPDDKITKPGTEVPAPKKGGYGRIFSNIPYGIGAHANRQRSRNSTVRGLDPGAPRSEKLAPEEKKKPSREIVRKTKKEDFELWVNNLLDEGYDLSGYTWEGLYEEYIQNEAYDIYDVILSHLLDEGYAETQEAAEAIMVNMSEDWIENICEMFGPSLGLDVARQQKPTSQGQSAPKPTAKPTAGKPTAKPAAKPPGFRPNLATATSSFGRMLQP